MGASSRPSSHPPRRLPIGERSPRRSRRRWFLLGNRATTEAVQLRGSPMDATERCSRGRPGNGPPAGAPVADCRVPRGRDATAQDEGVRPSWDRLEGGLGTGCPRGEDRRPAAEDVGGGWLVFLQPGTARALDVGVSPGDSGPVAPAILVRLTFTLRCPMCGASVLVETDGPLRTPVPPPEARPERQRPALPPFEAAVLSSVAAGETDREIGRASCRERV